MQMVPATELALLPSEADWSRLKGGARPRRQPQRHRRSSSIGRQQKLATKLIDFCKC
jgi:hypothetical protein